METKSRRVELPTIREESCGFEGYDPTSLMTDCKTPKTSYKKRDT